MKKILQRLKLRNQQFKKHPVTQQNQAKALFRYISFNTLNQVFSRITYKWVDNLKFYASKGDAGIVGNIYYGLLEFEESMFLLHFIESEDIFLDIGSNVGHYSILASGINKCKSIAIEPVPDTYKKLLDQIKLNKLSTKIQPMNIGVADKPSELYFSTDKGTMNRIVKEQYKNSVKIPVDTIDRICIDKEITLMKIDVEGYEKFVLEGAKKTLEKESLKAIIIEINYSNRFYDVKNEEVAGILESHNFKPFAYNPEKKTLTQLDSYNKQQFNTIYIRDLDFVNSRLVEANRIKIWNMTF